MFLSGDSQHDTNGASSSSFVILFFSGGSNSSFIDHIFSSFLMFSRTGAPLNHSPLAFHLFRSVEDISEDSSFHSQFTQFLFRMLSHSNHLIQPVQSPFQVIFS